VLGILPEKGDDVSRRQGFSRDFYCHCEGLDPEAISQNEEQIASFRSQ
jgi:hypothetical protein